MFTRTGMLFGSRILREGENGGAAGGASQLPAQGAANQGQDNGNDNVEDFSNIWNTDDAGAGQPANGGNPNANQVQQPQQQVPAGEAFNQHIQSLNLGQGVDMQAIASGIQEGNLEPLQNAMQQIAANTYKSAILDANRVMDSKIQSAIDQAVTKANGSYQADQATRMLNQALPFTSSPAVKPVAQAVMSQLLKSGKTTEQAIEGVRGFFAQTSKLSAKDLGLNVAAKGAPGKGGFGNGGFPADDDANATDWIGALTGK